MLNASSYCQPGMLWLPCAQVNSRTDQHKCCSVSSGCSMCRNVPVHYCKACQSRVHVCWAFILLCGCSLRALGRGLHTIADVHEDPIPAHRQSHAYTINSTNVCRKVEFAFSAEIQFPFVAVCSSANGFLLCSALGFMFSVNTATGLS